VFCVRCEVLGVHLKYQILAQNNVLIRSTYTCAFKSYNFKPITFNSIKILVLTLVLDHYFALSTNSASAKCDLIHCLLEKVIIGTSLSSKITLWVKKTCDYTFVNIFTKLLTNFLNSFTGTLCRKFAIM